MRVRVSVVPSALNLLPGDIGRLSTVVDSLLDHIEFEHVGTFHQSNPHQHPSSTFCLLSNPMVSLTGLLWSFFRDTLPDGGIAFGDEEQETSSPAAIVSQCEIFMRKNLLTGTAYGHDYSFNRPSSFKYSPSQWLWGEKSSAFFRLVLCLERDSSYCQFNLNRLHTNHTRLGSTPDLLGCDRIARTCGRRSTIHAPLPAR